MGLEPATFLSRVRRSNHWATHARQARGAAELTDTLQILDTVHHALELRVGFTAGRAEEDADDGESVPSHHGAFHAAVLLLVVYHVDLAGHRQVVAVVAVGMSLQWWWV